MKTVPKLGRLALVESGYPIEYFLLKIFLGGYCQRRGMSFFTASPKQLKDPCFFSSSYTPFAGVVILGPRSDYDLGNYLNPKARNNLIQYANNGGSIIGINKGFSMLCTSQRHRNKTVGNMHTLGFLPGTAQNTLERKRAETRRPKSVWLQTTVTPIRLTNLSSTHQHPIPMVYWNGPSFFPDSNDIISLMNYAELESDKSPLGELAAVMRSYGDGSVLGIGPHPEISSQILTSTSFANLGFNRLSDPNGSHTSGLEAALREGDEKRLHFLDLLLDLNLKNSVQGSRSLRIGRDHADRVIV